ncbi:MAG: TRAP transporter large permease subunit, partial [Paracoccaceae bacterium]
MTNPEVALLMLGLFIVLVLLGFPIAFTLLAMGVAFGYYAYNQGGPIESFSDIFNNNIFYLLNQNTYSVMENPILVAIPLFLFMGYVVERANIVDKLFFSLYMAARNLPGSLAIAALLTCAVFSTASGIVGAVVTLMGLLAFPAMANANYNKSFASGVICAGGTLGILIPPSIMLIVYAAIADLSPLRLYAAAVFPGLLLAGLYIVYVIVRVWMNPSLAPKPTMEDVPPPLEIYKDLLFSFVPLTVLIALVLGSILGGLATPAEAAAMGALGGMVLAVLYRSMTWTKLKESVFLTAKATAMVCWLFVGSWTFASVFSYLGGHDIIADWVGGMDLQPWQFLVLAQIIIFLL